MELAFYPYTIGNSPIRGDINLFNPSLIAYGDVGMIFGDSALESDFTALSPCFAGFHGLPFLLLEQPYGLILWDDLGANVHRV